MASGTRFDDVNTRLRLLCASGKFGRIRRRLEIIRLRLRQLPLIRKYNRQVVARVRVLRVGMDGLAKAEDRLIPLVALGKRDAHTIVRPAMSGAPGQGRECKQ